ncbi:MAG: hypothetical protein WAN22_26870, partial [Solirubrobacteraceae bacterium]
GSAAVLAAGTSQAIGKRLSRRLNGTSVAPGFTPKRNSELSDNRGRRPHDALRLEFGEKRDCGPWLVETCICVSAGARGCDRSRGPICPVAVARG